MNTRGYLAFRVFSSFKTRRWTVQSPKERQAAIEQMAVVGNASAIPALAAALKKEPRSDIRAVIVAGLARIRDTAAVPVLAETLQTDLDKDVRLQAIDSLLRLYIPIEDPDRFNHLQSREERLCRSRSAAGRR